MVTNLVVRCTSSKSRLVSSLVDVSINVTTFSTAIAKRAFHYKISAKKFRKVFFTNCLVICVKRCFFFNINVNLTTAFDWNCIFYIGRVFLRWKRLGTLASTVNSNKTGTITLPPFLKPKLRLFLVGMIQALRGTVGMIQAAVPT